MEKVYITWEQVEKSCDELAQHIKNNFYENDYELIGLARGGLIPAVIIAHKLGVRVKVLDIHSYTDICQSGEMIVENSLELDATKKHIFIDDIYDTGATYEYVRNNYKCDEFYVLIDKPHSDIYGNTWIVFPWESK